MTPQFHHTENLQPENKAHTNIIQTVSATFKYDEPDIENVARGDRKLAT